ncbi:hypothetical protein DH2020_013744 [Rehmannia glutinosa]|uniref:Hikeshi-like N-terminal domain-containing protein n=1 Tax=Rehmannia glutinosa TaxID=99300 RepID=A0ABR0X6N6_REHGL
MFGVVFPNRSFPLDISTFTQIDATHWLLDMNHFVGESYDSIRDICIFLLNNFTLPPDKALALYIQSPGSPFLFCGAVTLSRPSAVLSLPWPDPGSVSVPQLTAPDAPLLSAKIGVSVEDLATLSSLDVAAERKIERLALKVGRICSILCSRFVGLMGRSSLCPPIFWTGGLRSFRKGLSVIRNEPGDIVRLIMEGCRIMEREQEVV